MPKEESSGDDQVVSLAPEVMARLDKLLEIQKKRDEAFAAYEEEKKALDLKYQALYDATYKERSTVVKEGIPNFWMQAMQNHRRVAEFIEEDDEPALASLEDITFSYMPDMKGFKLIFKFGPNDFFTDSELTKTFYVPNLSAGSMYELDKAEGCEVHWKAGKDLTVKEVKKTVKKGKGRAKTVTKVEPVPSFFRFFETTQMVQEEMEEMEQEEAMALYEQIQSEADVGFALMKKVIPNAVNWFTGEAEDDEDEDDEEDGDYDDEDGEDEEDEDEEEEEEEEEAPKLVARGRGAAGAKGGKGGKGKKPAADEEDEDDEEGGEATAAALAEAFAKNLSTGAPGAPGANGQNPPECKQQ